MVIATINRIYRWNKIQSKTANIKLLVYLWEFIMVGVSGGYVNITWNVGKLYGEQWALSYWRVEGIIVIKESKIRITVEPNIGDKGI